MAPRLKTLVIENFRSLRGKVVIPLDAQVVLVHGTNGMGKTSVLSAIELGLSGKINHLVDDESGYQKYLTHIGTSGGSISLSTTGGLQADGRTGGTLSFASDAFSSAPLLGADDARFFAERCYLPQATLGRLLEIYDDQKTNSTSPLTRFVKELLGLDPLDAIVDGLYPAFHVTRVRNLVPDFRELESERKAVADQIAVNSKAITVTEVAAAEKQATIANLIAGVWPADAPTLDHKTDLAALRSRLLSDREEDRLLVELTTLRAALSAARNSWQSLPQDAATRDRVEQERQESSLSSRLAAWRQGQGAELEAVLQNMRPIFSDLPQIDADPAHAHATAQRLATAEATRCRNVLATHATAAHKLQMTEAAIQRSSARIEELNLALSVGSQDARSLANALAGIIPHVSGDICPVCDRNYEEHDPTPLSAHIAAKIAALTSEAGRLQSMATERADESSRLSNAQRDKLSQEQELLTPDSQAEYTNRAASVENFAAKLEQLKEASDEGATLTRDAASAREAAAASRRHDEVSTSILPEIQRLVQQIVDKSLSEFSNVETALGEAEAIMEARVKAAEAVVSVRVRALSELELYEKDMTAVAAFKKKNQELAIRRALLDKADAGIDSLRENAKSVSEAAERVRSNIVKSVFNTTLNKVWRDLFVRLAPAEQFVPTFKLPEGERAKVEAVLETIHRSGQISGSPGAILSQGNLNTAALTLFLALHLTVPDRMPWLVLDDPVQSMDDVHTAQFAALLRSLSKGLGKQLVVAVHERALFDYLILELSPSYPGDSLIAVEISRNFEGDAIAKPRAFTFTDDRAIAA